MSLKYLFKKTIELTDSEKFQILALFNEIFLKNRTLDEQDNQYLNNVLGYSFHNLFYDEDNLIAHAAYIPSYYYINGKKILAVDGVDGMISKRYRDSTVLIDLLQFNRENLVRNNVQLEMGFPNKYAMKVYIKGRLYKKVGNMTTYILPYRIGSIRRTFQILNPFSILFCRLYVKLTSLIAKREETKYIIEKDAKSYNATRYKRMDGQYSRIQLDEFEFIYKIMIYEGIKTAFLIDVTKKSAQCFNKAIRYIIKYEKNNFDLLLYVGNLYFKFHGLIKIPNKFEPKEFNFAIKLLDKSLSNNSLYDIKNWDVNLSNYDLI